MGYINVLLQLFVVALLTGCMVGPDFHSATPPKARTYTGTPLPDKTVSAEGKKQYFIFGKDIPAEWWKMYHSPALNQLICEGLANSPNLAAARAALRQAQETVTAQIGSTLFPQVSLQLTGERQRFSGDTFGSSNPAISSLFNLYNTSVNVSYTLDLFGGARRQIEALAAQVDYQQYELEAAYLTLTSNIVTTAIAVASLKAQVQATRDIVRLQENQLTIVKKQYTLGGASGADVASQENLLATTRATLPPLEQSLVQNLHLLATLIGAYPDEKRFAVFNLNELHLPTRLPVSVPSSLARQRPDIRAAEALVHAASAQIGVATANLYPQITLNGAYGWESLTITNLFKSKNLVWNYTGSLLEPVFNAGALQAKKRAAIDAFQQSAAQYRQTVLSAFQNVADSLRALENDAKKLKAEQAAEAAALDSLSISTIQYKEGGINYLTLLNAQRSYQQARVSRIQAEAARYSDTAALFQALGGGWWNRNCCIT